MNRVSIQDYELKSLLDQVMNSRTSLYGALQGKTFPIKNFSFKKFSDSIVDAGLLLAAMEPLEFAAHSHLIAQAELKADRLSKSDLFELRKVKVHLMAWLVQLKARVDFNCT